MTTQQPTLEHRAPTSSQPSSPGQGSDVAMRQCPYCAEMIRAEAIKCRYCGSRLDRSSSSWFRSPTEQRVAGVCGGLAEHLGIPVALLRLAFIIASLVAFWGVIIYVALWIIMPVRPADIEPPPGTPRSGFG